MAHYDHVLPYLLHYWVPTYLPSLYLRPHILSFALNLALVSLNESLIHSGYTSTVLPSAIVLPGMARRLEAHMATRGSGNFGAIGLLDWIHDTSVQGVPDFKDDAEDEFDKRGGRDAAAHAVNEAGSMAKRLRGSIGGKERKRRS